MPTLDSNEELERLTNEYVDRWYLSEDGDSDALKASSKGEMKRQMMSIILADREAAIREALAKVGHKDNHPGEPHYMHTSEDQTNTGIAGVRLVCSCGRVEVIYDPETHASLNQPTKEGIDE